MADQSEFMKGCEHARDLCLCAIFGIQNTIGNEEAPEYKALQAAYDLIAKRHGDIFSPYKG